MPAACFTSSKARRWPVAGPGEVRLRVRNCSTCGTDVKIFRNGHPHLSPPRVLGHEIAGEIDQVGDGVTGWAVGDRVQVIAAIPDGSCPQCRRGRPSVCANQESMGYQYDGGFAAHLTVPAKVLAALGIGVALFVASSTFALRRLGGPVLATRLLALAGLAVGLVGTWGLAGSRALPPVVPLVVVAIVLLVLVTAQQLAPPEAEPAAGQHVLG